MSEGMPDLNKDGSPVMGYHADVSDDFKKVRNALDQYEAWGLREGWTAFTFGKDALDRIQAAVERLRQSLEAAETGANALAEQNERLRLQDEGNAEMVAELQDAEIRLKARNEYLESEAYVDNYDAIVEENERLKAERDTLQQRVKELEGALREVDRVWHTMGGVEIGCSENETCKRVRQALKNTEKEEDE